MRDRLPLLGLSFALLIGVVALLFTRASARGEFAEPLSTYRSDADGARGLYLIAQRVGLKPQRRSLDLEHIEGTPELVLLGVEGDAPDLSEAPDTDAGIDPWWSERLNEHESAEIIRAVEAGATLLYAVGRDHPLLEQLGVELMPLEDPTPRELVPLSPSPFSRGVRLLQSSVAGYVTAPGALPLLVDANAGVSPVAILIKRGAGRIVVLAAPRLVENASLLVDDNAAFLVNVLRELEPAGAGLQFDEYHHGFQGERSVMSYAAKFGLPWVILQAIFVLALWSAARRRVGPPAALRDDRPRASADYLLAMARIYQRGRHRQHVAQLLLRGVLRPLQLRVRAPRTAGVDEVAEALSAREEGVLAGELRRLAQQARADLDEAQLQAVARAAHRLRDRLHAPLKGGSTS